MLRAPSLESFLALEGVSVVRHGLVGVLPTAASGEVFDVSVRGGRALLAAAGGKARVLVVPGSVSADGDRSHWDDPLAHDLAARPPLLAWNALYLTSHASQCLEGSFLALPRGVYAAPSGQNVPIVRIAGARPGDDPRRNPRPFGRVVKGISRTALAERLRSLLTERVTRLEGMLGCGKSRLAWEVLRAAGENPHWTSCGGRRAATEATLRRQLLRLCERGFAPREPGAGGVRTAAAGTAASRAELLANPRALAALLGAACDAALAGGRSPVRLVIDDLERATPEDFALIGALWGLRQLGVSLRLLLIGRTGLRWPVPTLAAPLLRVPPLGLTDANELGRHLTQGLSIPTEVQQRFLDAAAGNPFALEEGIHELIQQRGLRRIYGSFFFSGNAATGFRPSARWIRHVEAEARRIGAAAPLRALACAGTAVPAGILRLAVETLAASDPVPAQWPDAFLAAEWLHETETPWGAGLEFVCPAITAAIEETTSATERLSLRREVGRRLAAHGGRGLGDWLAYRMLAGAAEALPTLLAAAGAQGEQGAIASGVPADELIDALCRELAPVADPKLRLEILWALLPLAHRHQRLTALRVELDEALALAREHPQRLMGLRALQAELQEEQGDFSDAEGSLRTALETAIRRESDGDRKALLSIRLGRVMMREERYDEARRLFEEIQPLLSRAGRSTLAASCDFYLGNIALHEHRLQDARAHHEVALAARQEKGLRGPASASLSALGATALCEGFYAESLDRFETARRLLGDGGDPSFTLLGAGRAQDRMGDFAGASALLRQALSLRQGNPDSMGEAVARVALAENQLHLDHVDVARRELLQAHFLLSLRAPSRTLGDVEQMLGRVALRQHQIQDAIAHFRTALEIHRARQDRAGTIVDLGWNLEAARVLGDDTLVGQLAATLRDEIEIGPYPERGEIVDMHLFRATTWLRQRVGTGVRPDVADPVVFLRRAYGNLVRKMSRLTAESRNRFLLQVPSNREILQAATQHGVAGSA